MGDGAASSLESLVAPRRPAQPTAGRAGCFDHAILPQLSAGIIGEGQPSGGQARTRAGSKLPEGPQREAAHHRQAHKGAERADDAPTVKSRLHFFACD